MATDDSERALAMWRYRGQERPPFAEPPGPGQQSVWDFPRPPRLEPVVARLRVVAADGAVLADTVAGLRICETASAPTYYLPPVDVAVDHLVASGPRTFCEWKGEAEHLALRSGGPPVGWTYLRPTARFAAIAGWLAFYPSRVACFVGDEQARAQPGGFYGGWVTDDLAGPIKGGPGSGGW